MNDLFSPQAPKPSDEQREAIVSEFRRLLVVAGPGTGKTWSMIERGLWLAETGRVPDSGDLLYLTFTVKAAQEVAERFRKRRKNVNAYTFHGFAYHLIQLFGDGLTAASGGLLWPFTVLDELDQVELLKEILHDFRWKGLRPEKLARYHNGGRKDRDLPKLPKGMSRADLVAMLVEFERRKIESNAVDFAGLITLVHRLLDVSSEFSHMVRNLYRGIFVDEFQDTDGAQYALVTRILRPDSFLTLVGDDDQAIYTWRDADPRLMVGESVPVYGLSHVEGRDTIRLERWGREDVGPFKVLALGLNRRSVADIVEGSRRLIEDAKNERTVKPLRALRTVEGEVEVFRFGKGEEGERLPGIAAKLLAYGSTAILTRTNMSAKVLAGHLRREGVPCYLAGERAGIMDEPTARPVVYLLRVLSNRFDRWSLLRSVFHLVGHGLDAEFMAELRAEFSGAQDLLAGLESKLPHGGDGHATVQAARWLQEKEDGPDKLRKAVEFLKLIMDTWGATCERIGDWADSWASTGGGLAEFLFFATHYGANLEEREGYTGAEVWVSTVHRAKGREFDAVVFSNFESHAWPGRNEEEDRRTAYVAMTRARNVLVMTWRTIGRVWNEWKALEPSPWLALAFPKVEPSQFTESG